MVGITRSKVIGEIIIQLTQSEQNRIDAFQINMLRRILRVPPTHIDRSWTNQKVIDAFTERYGYVHTKLSSKWKKQVVLLGHVLRAPQNDPMRHVLFEAGTNLPRAVHTRRVGKPSGYWKLIMMFSI